MLVKIYILDKNLWSNILIFFIKWDCNPILQIWMWTSKIIHIWIHKYITYKQWHTGMFWVRSAKILTLFLLARSDGRSRIFYWLRKSYCSYWSTGECFLSLQFYIHLCVEIQTHVYVCVRANTHTCLFDCRFFNLSFRIILQCNFLGVCVHIFVHNGSPHQ